MTVHEVEGAKLEVSRIWLTACTLHSLLWNTMTGQEKCGDNEWMKVNFSGNSTHGLFC